MISSHWQSRELATEELEGLVDLKTLIYHAVRTVSKHWIDQGKHFDDGFMYYEVKIPTETGPEKVEIVYFRRASKTQGCRRIRLSTRSANNILSANGIEISIRLDGETHGSYNFNEERAKKLFDLVMRMK